MDIHLILIFLISLFTIFLTLSLAKKINTCVASCVSTLIGITIVSMFDPIFVYLFKVVFGSSFIGMSKKVSHKGIFTVVSAIIFTLIFYNLFSYYEQFGGALGFTAFLASGLTWLGLFYFRNKF